MSTAEDLHQDIVDHRKELAATVDALAYKLDVKARAAERWQESRPLALQLLGAAALLVTGIALVRRSAR